MKERKLPPKVKIIEALSAVADERIIVDDLLTNEGKCFSASNPGKIYEIHYNEAENTISSNDNGSIDQQFLGYPSIAFLLKIGKIEYDESILEIMKNIDWLKMKEQVNKDHESLYRLVLGNFHMAGYNVDYFVSQVEYIYDQISELHLKPQIVEKI